MRVQSFVNLVVAFDPTMTDWAFRREVSELYDTLQHVTAHTATLAALEAFALPMGDVAQGRTLLIEADREISVSLDGNDPILVSRPIDPAASSAADLQATLFLTGEFTTVTVTNRSATEATRLRACVVGDVL